MSASVTLTVDEANNVASNNNKYTFLSVLGQGSFGTVLQAEDSSTGRLVAIKILIDHVSVSEWFWGKKPQKITEGHQEVNILLELEHPNVLRLETHYEFNVRLQKGLAIVTEFCSKGSLQIHLTKLSSKGECLNKELCLLWYSQLAQGLNYIHSKGIVHRDLKPHNILISSDNSLKIADVGLAKAMWDLKNESKEVAADTTFHSYMSSVAGTPCYMSPEVCQEHYDSSSDIFSLGLIFITMSEVPKTLKPNGKWCDKVKPIGNLMCEYSHCRVVPPTSLMTPSLTHSDEDEVKLFDEMLQYDYHERPNLQKILSTIKEIEEKRKQPTASNEGSWWSKCMIL